MLEVPVCEGLFTWPSAAPQLIGVRDRRTGEIRFPAVHGLVAEEHAEEVRLSRRGRLWTWTVQAFRPKSPPYAGPDRSDEEYVPFGVGYVELDGQVIVEGRLTVNDPARLRIGMEMELAIVEFARRDDGTRVMTYAFRPVEGS